MRFLAVLELYKQGLVDLEQAEQFGEIEILWLGPGGLGGGDGAGADDWRDRATVAVGAIDAYEG